MMPVRWWIVIPSAMVLATATVAFSVMAKFTLEQIAQLGTFMFVCGATGYVALWLRKKENDKCRY